MVLASHEAYAWLENRVHGVGRVMLGVQPQRPRESVPVLRSEQETVFSGLQTSYLTCMTPSFPVLLTGVGNSEMNRPSHHLPIFISKPHTQPMEGTKRPSGAACVNAFRECVLPLTRSGLTYVACLALRAACWALVPVSLLEVEN